MFNSTNYTPDQLQAAREYAAGFSQSCADNCLNVDYGFAPHVTHQKKLVLKEEYLARAKEIRSGAKDHNFTIRQRMDYFLTCESVAFLPN